MPRLALSDFRRLVIKIGSSLLVDESGELNRAWLDSVADDIAALIQQGHEVLIVSSGAIAIGSKALGINRRRARLEELQAAAAAGQARLVHAYQESLERHHRVVAQILLTLDDTEHRRRFLNARRTLAKLLQREVVPIVNENDTVATDEIRYGDNDRLAARVAQMVMADALILLSDVDGLYTANPIESEVADHIPLINRIGAETLAMAGEPSSDVGSGGMLTKVQAAQIATHAGCSTVIAKGVAMHPLQALAGGALHTLFPACATPAAARKQWLAGFLNVQGELRLDQGAVEALSAGSSLLPVGVAAVSGNFCRGDVVSLLNDQGLEIGRGLAEYSEREAAMLCGCQSNQIESRLGYRGRAVMIHRDELVLFDND